MMPVDVLVQSDARVNGEVRTRTLKVKERHRGGGKPMEMRLRMLFLLRFSLVVKECCGAVAMPAIIQGTGPCVPSLPSKLVDGLDHPLEVPLRELGINGQREDLGSCPLGFHGRLRKPRDSLECLCLMQGTRIVDERFDATGF
jgi:hypothetical protein